MNQPMRTLIQPVKVLNQCVKVLIQPVKILNQEPKRMIQAELSLFWNYPDKSMGLRNHLNLVRNAKCSSWGLGQPPPPPENVIGRTAGHFRLRMVCSAHAKRSDAQVFGAMWRQICRSERDPPGMPESLRCLAFQPDKTGAIASLRNLLRFSRPFRPQS